MLRDDAPVRTAIRIDDDLYRQIKERAARSGRTVAAVLEEAVRLGLAPPSTSRSERYRVAVSGRGGLRPAVDITSNESLRDVLDEDLPLDALR